MQGSKGSNIRHLSAFVLRSRLPSPEHNSDLRFGAGSGLAVLGSDLGQGLQRRGPFMGDLTEVIRFLMDN